MRQPILTPVYLANFKASEVFGGECPSLGRFVDAISKDLGDLTDQQLIEEIWADLEELGYELIDGPTGYPIFRECSSVCFSTFQEE